MKRLILFAHYDKDNLVDDYVVRLLEGIKPHYERLVFVSDVDLSETECAKIAPFGEVIHTAPHGEYDFGSWKRAFLAVEQDLANYDEVLFVNDSCFGPVYNFDEMFRTMDQNPCDFWGVSGTIIKRINQYCVNSYFMGFRKPVVGNKRFQSFWKNITKLDNRYEIVGKYEFGLSDLLHEEGFKSDCYVGWYDTNIMVASAFFPKVWQKKRCPLVKIKLLRVNPEQAPKLEMWLDKLDVAYPRKFIDGLIKRYLGTKHPDHYDYRFPIFKTYYGHKDLLALKGRYTKNRKWWRFYIKILGIPLMIVLPSGLKDTD
ncbi:rhamnan synthesis F family protein [Terasakiella sp. SH-1]|uniref:rhamnan synthesis F family protein n=1 Tax=Terasakiella sp. SH-1 TaxID=2560057 RepID=UPI00142FD4C7|nr:rhamnan synthesis F family protein [Terasakiella sp. SH-1]